MLSSTSHRYVRRAAMAVGATVVGSVALVGPVATPAQALPLLPTCEITLSGPTTIPVVGQTLTSTLVINGADNVLLGLHLPILTAVVAVPDGTTTSTIPLPASPTSLLSLLDTTSYTLPYTVLPSDVGQQLVGVGALDPTSILANTPLSPLGLLLTSLGLTSPIKCTTIGTPPVVSPPSTGGGTTTSTTTLGATPVSSAPRVVGKMKRGKTVHADLGTVEPGTTVTYQWLRKRKHHGAVAIGGATGPTYKITRGNRGKRIAVVVTYVKTGYWPTAVGSQSRRVR
ncbi:MAG: hypothetical protein JWO46_599 [Nocardioidaceae bacterium]|nr:hypothetical protein [Nocardioidaceae bacterium]